jgi:predicted trehalose synthase
LASEDEVEELMQTLVSGLWNRLSEHQNSRTPFRLPRAEVKPTRPALLALAQTRSQELAGFVDGLFGDEEEMDLPEKAHEAVNVLAEMHAMFAGAMPLLADESTPAARVERPAAQLSEAGDHGG